MRRNGFTVVVAVAAGLLLSAPIAGAVVSSEQGYAGVGGEAQTEVAPAGQNGVAGVTDDQSAPRGGVGGVGGAGGPGGAGQSSPAGGDGGGGTLPFTGLDLAFMLAFGAALVLCGIALRRRTGRRRDSLA